MSRRKQGAPQRLHGLDSFDADLVIQASADCRRVISESRAEDGDEETLSGEDTTRDMHVNMPSAQLSPIGNGQISRHCPCSLRCPSRTDGRSENKLGETCICQINGTSLGTTDNHSSVNQQISDLSHLRESSPSSKPLSHCDSCTTRIRHKQSTSSTSPICPSPAPAAPEIHPQMALVMSPMPGELVYGSQKPLHPRMTYFSSVQEQQEDKPLDLSSRSARSASFSSTETKLVALRNRSCSDSITNAPLPVSDFSSLQSLQQRFGEGVPLHPSHKSAATVIPLPANIACKSAVSINGGWWASNFRPSTVSGVGSSEDHDITAASVVSGVTEGESNLAALSVLGDEHVNGVWSRHTTHRCSCHNTFSTLYSLSLHLQETGHTPSCSKGSSPIDYPKLVRGQDMWLNQESEQTRQILRCIQCGESFESLPLLTVHMMQTQHYTKIVNSDHTRRPHRCSTYCGRERDPECVFKCQVCHQTFGDMGGLASHMVVSGHHRKQMPRHVVSPGEVTGDVCSTSRQGKRKRCFQGDIFPVAVNARSFSVASLLNYRRKQNGVSNSKEKEFSSDQEDSGHSISPDSLGLVVCDICGQNVERLCFSSHARECLSQKGKVVSRNRPTLEKDGSTSEDKLLQPDFSLDLPPHQQKFSDCVSSENEEPECVRGSGKSVSQVAMEIMFPERSCSLPVSHLAQMISPSSCLRRCASPRARASDMLEVPHKKLCSWSESWQEVDKTYGHDGDDQPLHEGVAHTLKLEPSQEDEGSRGSEPNLMYDDCSQAMQYNERLTPKSDVTDSTVQSLDCTYSALYKLDLFSRSLQLSPPRRNISLGPGPPTPQQCKVTSKKEVFPTRIRSPLSKSPPDVRSPLSKSPTDIRSPSPVSSPQIPHSTSGSPNPGSMTFDIIDPNIEPQVTVCAPSALEAMESFINKSFSAKPRMCSPNLTSMFSPFRSCFPNPGPLLPHGGIVLEPPSAHTSRLATFSRFFKTVPAIPTYSETASSQAAETISRGANINSSQLTATNPAMLSLSEYYLETLAPISCVKVPVARYTLELPKTGTICHGDISPSSNNSEEMVPVLEKQIYKFGSCPELLTSRKSHKSCTSPDPLEDSHKVDSTADVFIANPLIAQQNHKYLTYLNTSVVETNKCDHSSDTVAAQTAGRYGYETSELVTVDKLSENAEAQCQDERGSRELFLNPRNSSSQPLPHAESLTVKQERKRNKQLQPDLGTASSNTQLQPDLGTASSNKQLQPNLATASSNIQPNLVTASSNIQPNLATASSNKQLQPDLGTASSNKHLQPNLATASSNIQPNLVTASSNIQPDLATASSNKQLQPNIVTASSNIQPNLVTASSNRSDAGLGYSQQEDETFVTIVKNEINYQDTTLEDDHRVTNENVTEATEASRSKVNSTDEKPKVNTELENCEVNTQAEKCQDVVIQNVWVETAKLVFQTGCEERRDNKEIEEDVFNTHDGKHKVDKNTIEKTQSECFFHKGKQTEESVDINSNKEKARVNNFNLSLESHEHKINCRPAAREDVFTQTPKEKTWLDDNDAVSKLSSGTDRHINKTFLTDFIRQKIGNSVSETVCKDIQTGPLMVSVCKENCHENSRLNSCQPDWPHENSRLTSSQPDWPHENDMLKKVASTMKYFSAGQATMAGWSLNCGDARSLKCGVAHSLNCGDARSKDCDMLPGDNKCDTSNTDDDADNHADKHFDDLISDAAGNNKDKGKCTEVEIKTENVDGDKVSRDTETSQNVDTVSRNNVITLENNNHIIGHHDCVGSRSFYENEIKLEVSHENKVYCENVVTQGDDVEHNKKGPVHRESRSRCLTKMSSLDCEVTHSSVCEKKLFVQCVEKLSELKSEYIEDTVTLQNDTIEEEEFQYTQTSLQKKNNVGTSSKLENRTASKPENRKRLSEHETSSNSSEMDRQKKQKSALDYLSSFVYSQPLCREHAPDSLQRLLATNDLTYLTPDSGSQLADCSSHTLTPHTMFSTSSQTCSTENHEDDESCLADLSTSEAGIHEYMCAACRRRFASKGSYRYHLSKCHLSSVKKYSIKETLSRSPYVYLPLDHTVKLSKYYQVVTQKLAHEGL